MSQGQERGWFWATLALSSISMVAFVFAFWELVENHFFRDLDYVSLHYLYVSRGIASSVILAGWAAWFVLRQRRQSERELRRSRERYRGLLDASPSAIALLDTELRVCEWNAAAARLYGHQKEEVLGQVLPTVPSEKRAELHSLLWQVSTGQPMLDLETLRQEKSGVVFEVQLSLLLFRERGRDYFLEVTSDIRERVRLRQTLIQVEKLTSMGKMAAGTAHHLNTPLASMLLRVQMMRERAPDNGVAGDLQRLESSIGFCQQFVRRMLDFTRRPSQLKQAEEIGGMIDAVLGFLSPSLLTKQIELSLDMEGASGLQVICDRNQLEALLLILISNAQDAVTTRGTINVSCRASSGMVEIVIADNGCGIGEQDLARVFEPFFTTKPPGKGTGLGLAMAQNIVSEHGGTIRVESQRGAGTRVIVQLPLFRAAAAGASEVVREVAH